MHFVSVFLVLVFRHQAGFKRSGHQQFQIATADFGMGELGSDHFALFGKPDLSVHGTVRLGQNGFVGRATAASDSAAASVKQAQLDAHLVEKGNQLFSAL